MHSGGMHGWESATSEHLHLLFAFSFLGLACGVAARARARSAELKRFATCVAGACGTLAGIFGFMAVSLTAASEEPFARPAPTRAIRVVPAARGYPRDRGAVARCFRVVETADTGTRSVLLVDECSGDTWRLAGEGGRIRWTPIPWD